MDIELLPEPSVPPDHDGKLELRDLNRALASLSPGQRTALILVSVSGFSYEEAAEICGCAVGTIKSRVARARETLLEMLEGRQPMAAAAGRGSLRLRCSSLAHSRHPAAMGGQQISSI